MITETVSYKIRSGMIANETTLHKRPNETEINIFRSLNGLQQWAKPLPDFSVLSDHETLYTNCDWGDSLSVVIQ